MVGLLRVGGRAGSPAGVPNRADHAGAVGARRHGIRVSFATTGRDRRPGRLAGPSRLGLEALVDVADQERQAVLERQLVGRDRELRELGRLVGAADAGELRDLARPGTPVEALRVARLAGLERGLDVDLVEVLLGRRPGPLAVRAVGRDEARDDEEAG